MGVGAWVMDRWMDMMVDGGWRWVVDGWMDDG